MPRPTPWRDGSGKCRSGSARSRPAPRRGSMGARWIIAASKCSPGDVPVPVFSFLGSPAEHPEQIVCHLTRTTLRTHDIIRGALHRSPMYNGGIEGVGSRYCPSVEDKVVRFADKSSHQVFIEPEGLGTAEVYPNGISTSLPFDVQLAFVRTIPGLENAHITRRPAVVKTVPRRPGAVHRYRAGASAPTSTHRAPPPHRRWRPRSVTPASRFARTPWRTQLSRTRSARRPRGPGSTRSPSRACGSRYRSVVDRRPNET
jgi:hypothetical protein